MPVVIKVENLSKQYRLGEVSTGTLVHDLNRWWHKIRGKEDPYLKISEVNDRTVKGKSEYVWALKDVNFEVEQGEVLGIIGRNGAGKSTLLKILSQVTSPTTGIVKIKGRIASLLEVGTGFHPELTGRENIFLNGAILGMTKAEIKRKFDEIVAFSGVERYIDTPVKRYSSGMYVRLAFAVAAHLEPEILVVDEVLAVGDAEFQKKCLGKMKDVSGEGRTVLFVSHNMAVIRLLCKKALYLKNGLLEYADFTDKVVEKYLRDNHWANLENIVSDIPENLSLYFTGEAKFKKCYLVNEKNELTNQLQFKERFSVILELDVYQDLYDIISSVFIINQYGEKITMSVSDERFKPMSLKKGKNIIKIHFKDIHLMPGSYSLGFIVAFFKTGNCIDYIESFYPFTVLKESIDKNFEYPWETIHGYFIPETEWEFTNTKY
ncbi:MAG: ABC transporter ATP-binding protein [Bacteroidia bacterium]|nr:ABC transporter ATP-binding protein [Bacteroidia bacterium]